MPPTLRPGESGSPRGGGRGATLVILAVVGVLLVLSLVLPAAFAGASTTASAAASTPTSTTTPGDTPTTAGAVDGDDSDAATGPGRLMVVIDTSGSMNTAGLATIRTSVDRFVDSLPATTEVGVVAFSDTARVVLAPGTDRRAVGAAVDKLQLGGETALYDALVLATEQLTDGSDQGLVLFSDGGDTRSTDHSLSDVLSAITAGRVRTEVIGFGTAESDAGVLAAIAAAGGGIVGSGESPESVNRALTRAGTGVDPTVVEAPDGLFVTGGPRVLGIPLLPVLGSVLLLAALATIGLTLVAPRLRGQESQRAAQIERYLHPGSRPGLQQVSPSSISTGLVDVGERVMATRESTTRTMQLIERADLPLRAGEWWVLRLLAVVVGMVLMPFVLSGGLGTTLVGILLGAVLGAALPSGVLRFLAGRRARAFEGQLADVLGLVASSLRSGFSLHQALDAVTRDAPQPAAKEFSRAMAEVRIGTDLADAIEALGERMESESATLTAITLRVQRQVGGNLAETLETTAETLRGKERLAGRVKALSAEGRLSAGILAFLPIGLFGYMYAINRDYLSMLWTRPLGIVMLVLACVGITVGILWMRKVVEVKV